MNGSFTVFILKHIVTSDVGYTGNIKNGKLLEGEKITVQLYSDAIYRQSGLKCGNGSTATVSLLQFKG